MTSHGLCAACGQVTSDYDTEARRWKCRPACREPEMLFDPNPPRLPGESRQEHRRRCREARGGA